VNVQVVTDPVGRVLWISSALPGRCHGLTSPASGRAVRPAPHPPDHPDLRTPGRARAGDRAYRGAGPWVTTGRKRPPGGELSLTQRTVNRAPAQARAPVERGMAPLKSWRVSRRARCSPDHMASIARSVLTPERQR